MSSMWTIRRSASDAKVAGLCGGVALRWNVDPVLVRVGWALLALSGGVGLVLYLAGWLLIPVEGKDTAPADDLFGTTIRRWPRELWVTLVVLASLAVFAAFGKLTPFSFGPAIVIAVVWYFGVYKQRQAGRTERPTPPLSAEPGAFAVPEPPLLRYPGPPTPFTEAAQAWQRRIQENARLMAERDSAARHEYAGEPATGSPGGWPAPPPANLLQRHPWIPTLTSTAPSWPLPTPSGCTSSRQPLRVHRR